MASLYGKPAMIIEDCSKPAPTRSRSGPNGETMLMLAARNGNPEAIKVLIAGGAEVNVTRNHFAARRR